MIEKSYNWDDEEDEAWNQKCAFWDDLFSPKKQRELEHVYNLARAFGS